MIPYAVAMQKQIDYVQDIFAGKKSECFVFCTHPPVVTKGRATQDADLFSWGGEVVETNRGGRATYHGPSQLVLYPMLNLRKDRKDIRKQDVHAYLRWLENICVQLLQKLDIPARGPAQPGPDETGVWVGERKIASIGVAIKNWITYHGLALNIDQDPQAFSGIHPCGLKNSVMTSVEEILGDKVSRFEMQTQLQDLLGFLN